MQANSIGDWWIDTEGIAHYADGDIGDINHENFIVAHCILPLRDIFKAAGNALLSELADTMERFIDVDGVDIIMLREYVINWSDGLHRDGRLTDAQVDDIFAYLLELSGCDARLMDVVFNTQADTRDYAVCVMNWIRVADNNMDCKAIDRATLLRVADGLYDAAGDAVEQVHFDLYAKLANVLYVDIPFIVFTSGKPMALRDYMAPCYR